MDGFRALAHVDRAGQGDRAEFNTTSRKKPRWEFV